MNPTFSAIISGTVAVALLGTPLSGLSQTLTKAVTTANTAKPVTKTLKVERLGKSAEIKIPEGCSKLTVDYRPRGSLRWQSYKTLSPSGAAQLFKMSDPTGVVVSEWRATATITPPGVKAASAKLPTTFFKGKKSFAKSASETYDRLESAATLGASIGGALKSSATPGLANLASVVASDSAPTSDSTTEVQESDIWKVDGSTVFFFNQLRGLQVIDIADKANPKLKANYRLAESGEDMFVLNASTPGEKDILLLTRTTDAKTQVVSLRYSGSTVKETARYTTDGWLNDSRIAGNQLYIVTTNWAYYDQVSQNTDRTTLHQVEISAAGALTEKQSFDVLAASGSSIVSSAPGWIAVSSSSYKDWNKSNIEVFKVTETGAAKLNSAPLSTIGRVSNKFNVNVDGSSVCAITSRWEQPTDGSWRWVPITTLENFKLDGAKLASLEIIRGESLFATRFAKNTLYAVTFQQTDPLWIIDLEDKANPKITGHLEVPGFSTYIEPIGNFLFSIGLEDGKVAASLFNVADPEKPTLADRCYLDGKWGWSEALYNEKALKVLPDQGLALIPYSGSTSVLQLLDISTAATGKLTLRGQIQNATPSRRATVVDKSLVSITQEQLLTADISNRDKPAIQSEVLLAWPVDRVVVSGDYLLQIATGNAWSAQTPSIKVSRADDENTVLQDIDAGAGTITDVSINGNRLAVLRRVPVANTTTPNDITANSSLRIAACVAYIPRIGGLGNMALDVYDISSLPKLTKTGSAEIDLSTESWWETSNLRWLSPSLVGTLVQRTTAADSWIRPILYAKPIAISEPIATNPVVKVASVAAPKVASFRPAPVRYAPKNTALQVFDVSNIAGPKALPPVEVAATANTKINVTAAGDNLFVLGFGRASEPVASPTIYRTKGPAWDWQFNTWNLFNYTHNLAVIDFSDPAKPVKNESIDLPGRLFALGTIQKTGFIAYSESCITDPAGTVSRQIQATAIDGKDGYLVTALPIERDSRLAALDSDVFVSTKGVITPFRLSEGGTFTPLSPVTLKAQPDALRLLGGALFSSQGLDFSRISWPLEGAKVETARIAYSSDVERLAITNDGSVVIPSGQYGVLRIFGK